MTRRLVALLVAGALMGATAVSSDQNEPINRLAGTWQGAWYRGMTSGQMTLEVMADGSGTVAFTNLETFGEEPAPLVRTRFDGSVFSFNAVAGSRGAFAGQIDVPEKPDQLRGKARYDGFPVTFELKRIRQ